MILLDVLFIFILDIPFRSLFKFINELDQQIPELEKLEKPIKSFQAYTFR